MYDAILPEPCLSGTWYGDTKNDLQEHLESAGHAKLIRDICRRDDVMDCYQEAIRSIEGEQVLAL